MHTICGSAGEGGGELRPVTNLATLHLHKLVLEPPSLDVMPRLSDQNLQAQLRRPMDVMSQSWSIRVAISGHWYKRLLAFCVLV